MIRRTIATVVLGAVLALTSMSAAHAWTWPWQQPSTAERIHYQQCLRGSSTWKPIQGSCRPYLTSSYKSVYRITR